MLLVAIGAVLVTNISTGYCQGKDILIRAMQILVRKALPSQEKMSQKVVGSYPTAGKIFFSNEILVNVILLVLLWNLYTKKVGDVQ